MPVISAISNKPSLDSLHWYVAVVGNNSEKSTVEALTRMGYETYLPLQTEYRMWRNGRRTKIDKVVLPARVFVKCTEKDRRATVVWLPQIRRFLTDRATRDPQTGVSRVAVIPDEQMDLLRFMVGNSDNPVTFTDNCYQKGDKVKVVRGSLKGLEGEVLEAKNDMSEIIIRLDVIGCAKLSIPSIDLEILSHN